MAAEPQLHLGVEEEFALLHSDGSFANEVEALLARVPARYRPERIKKDLHYCMAETATPVCSTPAEVEAALVELRRVVGAAAAALGLRVIAAGVHPTAPMAEGKLVETPRFRRLIAGGALRGDGVHFGLHLHISLDGPKVRVALVNRLRWHIPDFVALAVNSPFYRGVHRGVKSVRLAYYEPVPTAGPPPPIKKFGDWKRVLKSYARYGVEAERDYYGDIRHRSDPPTVEVRVMDTQQSVAETMMVASYVWALTRHYGRLLADDFLPPMTATELSHNRRLAWHTGLDGPFLLYHEHVRRPEYIEHTLRHLIAAAPPEAPYLEQLLSRVAAATTGADRQLGFVTSDRADAPALLAELERRFAEGI